MTDFKVGLFIFKLDSFVFLGGVRTVTNPGKVRLQQREMYYAYCYSVQRFESDQIEIGLGVDSMISMEPVRCHILYSYSFVTY